MNRTRSSCAALALAAVGVLAPILAPSASASSTYRTIIVTRATDSNGAQYAQGTTAAKVSGNGQWMTFSRLGTNGSYVKSLVSGETTLVSLNDADQPANAASTIEAITADGSEVLFSTAATNMGQGSPTIRDLYVRKLSNGATERVNVMGNPGTAVPVKPGESALSDDGATVAFATTSFHVFARSLANHTTERVDVTSAEVPVAGTGSQPSVSATGRFVTFTSYATDLVPGDTNFVPDVFERDRQAGTTERVSVSDTELAADAGTTESSVSADGRYVAFTSDATNLVVGDTNASKDVFLRDVVGQGTVRISVKTGGGQANGQSSHPDVNAAGTMVAFESTADDMSSNAANGKTDVFTRDISGNFTDQWGNDGWTPSNQGATGATLAANGVVAATSSSTNLLVGDTNGAPDAFVEGYQPLGPFGGYDQLVDTLHAEFGRSPATNAAVTADLDNGRLTAGHLIVRLAHEPVWAQHREPVARLYQAFFHRQPDLNGLNYWVKKRAGGTKLGVIAAFFASSSEFTTAYGSVDSTAFVTLVYSNVLQRKPDAAGLDHWVNKMAGGMSRGDVMVAFSESSEGKRFLAPEVDATLIGLAMIKTMPSKALWTAAATASRDHHMAEWGALTYLNSPEFESAVFK